MSAHIAVIALLIALLAFVACILLAFPLYRFLVNRLRPGLNAEDVIPTYPLA